MTFTAAQVLNRTRDFHPAFGPEDHPDAVLLRQVSADERRLLNRLAAVAPEQLGLTTITFPLAGYDFAAGTALVVASQDPLAVAPGSCVAQLAQVAGMDGEVPVTLIPYGTRHAPAAFPYGWLRGFRLYLGGAAQDWTGYSQVRIDVVPMPPERARTATIALPDDALEILALRGAALLAQRTLGLDPQAAIAADYLGQADEAEALLVQRLADVDTATTWRILDTQ